MHVSITFHKLRTTHTTIDSGILSSVSMVISSDTYTTDLRHKLAIAMYDQVLAFEEQLSQQVSCACFQTRAANALGSQQSLTSPVPGNNFGQHKLTRGRRSFTSESIAKLSPIDLQSSCSQEEHLKGESKGFKNAEPLAQHQGHGEKNSGTSTGRQLDSLVDEAHAEVSFCSV